MEMTRAEIVVRTGAESWVEIEAFFRYMSVDEICETMDVWWPSEDNVETAKAIYEELNK